jgi:chromosomal replication initiation ATPase DnaA
VAEEVNWTTVRQRLTMTPSRAILMEVSQKHRQPIKDLLSDCMFWFLVRARWEAFFRLHYELGWSAKRIGRLFGKDHSTVIYGILRHQGIPTEVARYSRRLGDETHAKLRRSS